MCGLKDHHPQQQGLRQICTVSTAVLGILKDHHPQQQGLRNKGVFYGREDDFPLKDHHPQQQGLRLPE